MITRIFDRFSANQSGTTQTAPQSFTIAAFGIISIQHRIDMRGWKPAEVKRKITQLLARGQHDVKSDDLVINSRFQNTSGQPQRHPVVNTRFHLCLSNVHYQRRCKALIAHTFCVNFIIWIFLTSPIPRRRRTAQQTLTSIRRLDLIQSGWGSGKYRIINLSILACSGFQQRPRRLLTWSITSRGSHRNRLMICQVVRVLLFGCAMRRSTRLFNSESFASSISCWTDLFISFSGHENENPQRALSNVESASIN